MILSYWYPSEQQGFFTQAGLFAAYLAAKQEQSFGILKQGLAHGNQNQLTG
jgi:hypothetical protein